MTTLSAGRPDPLGVTWDGEGCNVAVFSLNAESIAFCLFDEDGRETERITLPERDGMIWHGHVAGIGPGQRYGFRADGPYRPDQGHRFNPAKLLLDPYAKALSGAWRDDDALLGYNPNSPELDLSFNSLDSAPYVAKSVVVDPNWDWSGDQRPNRDWEETVLYEAHVKGLTKLQPETPEALRGTYEGLASPAMIDHLVKLGVTAVELLPVHAFLDDGFLLGRGLRNYWGYSTIGFFAPEPRYFGPAGAAGFREMVRRLHAAGIEVILDVVFNHTAEGNERGPTLCFRGLDNASYYRLLDNNPRYYVNDTGCGNTVNVSHPMVLRLVLDSLRYWVTQMRVDGFRFDLATVLGREEQGFDRWGGFFDALRQDPTLAGVKLIAEPWDIGPGGYQRGRFPPEFSEWNDAYRDGVRRFWRGDSGGAQALAGHLLGSAETFDRAGRRPRASLNFITAHDGFTLADLTAYAERHNLANGEDNRDGHAANYSDNMGAEGETDDPAILARRAQRRRNLLTTLLLSQGTPMLLAGDEIGNSQSGNNNAYCQDNEIGWIDWPNADKGLRNFIRRLTALRRAHPALRQDRFLHGQPRPDDGAPDVIWRAPDGGPLNWRDPLLRCFGVTIRCASETPDYAQHDDAVFIALNGASGPRDFILPAPGHGRFWLRGLDTAAPEDESSRSLIDARLEADSIVLFTRTTP